jgi:Negative regulator of sigma F
MSTLQAAVVLSALTVSATALAYSLVQQMAPGSIQAVPAPPLPIVIIASLTVVIPFLFSFRSEQNFWSSAWGCIRPGMIIATLAAAPLWFVLRRGAILSAPWTGAATGLLAGLAGATALEIRCPNLNAWHILAAHIGAAVLSTTMGFLIGLFSDRPPIQRLP